MTVKVWLPYTVGGSGTDVFTKVLARALTAIGVETVVEQFPHEYQYAPWLLRGRKPPKGVDCLIGNTWNAFAFARPALRSIAVEHLFLLDPVAMQYKSLAQRLFHSTLVQHYERATARAVARVVAVSEYTAGAYARGLQLPRPTVIRNGIDTEFFSPGKRGEPRDSSSPFRMLFVGNLSRRKGADMLPDILEQLGDGYELSYTHGLRERRTLRAYYGARPLGMLDPVEVRDEYRRADLLLFPTRLEGLPLVAMEAMSCGTPVVASDTGSLPEVISHGHDGLLCELNDVEAFVSAVRRLRSNPQELARMAQAARDTALSRFTVEQMATQYRNLLESL